jgi:hypothetical protein
MGHVHAGSYQLLMNIFVYLTNTVSVAQAPMVTTYLSLLVHVAVVAQIVVFCEAYKLPRHIMLLLVTAWALLPQTYEVWATALNVQWVLGVSVLFIFVMPTGWLQRHIKGAAVWCFVCGVSGVPAVLMSPAFLLRALIDRSRAPLVVSGVLGLCAGLQLAVLVLFGAVSNRAYPSDPAILALPLLLQTVLPPISSVDTIVLLGQALAQRLYEPPLLLGTIALGLGIMGTVLAIAASGRRGSRVYPTLFAWVFVTVVQTFGAAASDPKSLLIPPNGGRYYLFGSVCLCIMLAWGSVTNVKTFRVIALGLLLSIGLNGAIQAEFSSWMTPFIQGPSWTDQIKDCRHGATPCHILIWPVGWAIDILA